MDDHKGKDASQHTFIYITVTDSDSNLIDQMCFDTILITLMSMLSVTLVR
jgi:hypothetical protein